MDKNTMKASDYPICIHCQGIARPHILMFGDGEYVGHKEQENNFNKFMGWEIELAVLVGSSGAVPTNDYIALSLKNHGTKVININPDISADGIVNADIFLACKSEEAFISLDEEVNPN